LSGHPLVEEPNDEDADQTIANNQVDGYSFPLGVNR
jgi:hypothetical protein